MILSFLLILLFSVEKTNAQPGFDDDVEDTPIDGSILILLTGSLTYGLSKLKFEENK